MDQQRQATQQQEEPSQPKTRRTKISYDEYQQIAQLVCLTIKDMEREGQQSSVSQAEIVNRLVQKLEIEEGNGTSVEKAAETSRKVQNVIQHLITKENVLLIT